jgi:CxC5 like cysteine cluster associated with KDZ transposases
VAAMPNLNETAFPDLTFKAFSEFVFSHFGSWVSLATVLVLLFTMTENPELLSLHAWQQNPIYSEENNVQVSGWMKALAKALTNQLEEKTQTLFKKSEWPLNEDQIIISLGKKLDGLAKLLNLFSYNKKGKFEGKLKPVSHDEIKPVFMICPNAIVCQSLKCNPRSLQQYTRDRDIPKVDLIKGRNNFQNVPVLTGRCPSCGWYNLFCGP